MAGARSTNTFAEFMQRWIQDIGAAKLLPDADLGWLVNMETQVIEKARAPLDQMQQGGMTAAPPAPMGPGMVAGPGPMAPPMPPGAGVGAGPADLAALMGGGVMPNGAVGGAGPSVGAPRRDQSLPGSDDELRRLLSQ